MLLQVGGHVLLNTLHSPEISNCIICVQYLSESEGVPDFLSKLKGLVACLETSIDTSFLSLPLPVCRQLAQELDLVGWSK